jgi:hypothetical protein
MGLHSFLCSGAQFSVQCGLVMLFDRKTIKGIGKVDILFQQNGKICPKPKAGKSS